MKNILLPMLVALWFCQPARAQNSHDTPSDRAAIEKICAAETQAWLDNDFEAWAALHLKSEQDILIYSNEDGSMGQLLGWPTLEATIREAAKTGQKQPDKLLNENFQFTIRCDMAFVAYDQTLTGPDGKTHRSREHRVLIFDPAKGWLIQSVMAYYQPSK